MSDRVPNLARRVARAVEVNQGVAAIGWLVEDWNTLVVQQRPGVYLC